MTSSSITKKGKKLKYSTNNNSKNSAKGKVSNKRNEKNSKNSQKKSKKQEEEDKHDGEEEELLVLEEKDQEEEEDRLNSSLQNTLNMIGDSERFWEREEETDFDDSNIEIGNNSSSNNKNQKHYSSSSSITIIDLGKEIGGASYRAGIGTAMKHFDKFLQLFYDKSNVNCGIKFNEIKVDMITQELFNNFGGYLCANIAKVDTALGYFSKVRTYYLNSDDITMRKRTKEELDEAWVKRTRSRILKQFVIKCSKEGTTLSQRSTPMEEEDLEILCTLLLNRNNRSSCESRCLLICQWQTVGRISECFRLRLSHLEFYKSSNNRSIVVNFARTKTGIEQKIHIFIHATSWKLCPYHALACMLLNGLHQVADEPDIMFDYGRGSYSSSIDEQKAKQQTNIQYMNNLLKDLYEEWMHISNQSKVRGDSSDHTIGGGRPLKQNLKTHSTRSGSATYADQHASVHTQHVIMRGGWTVEGIQTIFNYIVGTAKTDSIVGRALSNYTTTDRGGICHIDDCFKLKPVEKRKFITFCQYLLPMDMEYNLRLALVSALVMHLLDFSIDYQHTLTYAKIIRAASDCNIDLDELYDWGEQIKSWFVANNVDSLPLSQLRNDDLIPAHTVKEHLTNNEIILKNVSKSLIEYKEQLHYLHNTLLTMFRKKEMENQLLSQQLFRMQDRVTQLERSLLLQQRNVETRNSVVGSNSDNNDRIAQEEDRLLLNSDSDNNTLDNSEDELLFHRTQRRRHKDDDNNINHRSTSSLVLRNGVEINTFSTMSDCNKQIIQSLLSETNIDVRRAFYEWYDMELHQILAFDSTISETERRKLNDFKKVIFFVKLVCERNCTITERPKNNPEALSLWRANIKSIAEEGTRVILNLIAVSSSSTSTNKNNTSTQRRQMGVSKFVRAVAKKINQIPYQMFPSSMKVIDQADCCTTTPKNTMKLYLKLKHLQLKLTNLRNKEHHRRRRIKLSNRVIDEQDYYSSSISYSTSSDEVEDYDNETYNTSHHQSLIEPDTNTTSVDFSSEF